MAACQKAGALAMDGFIGDEKLLFCTECRAMAPDFYYCGVMSRYACRNCGHHEPRAESREAAVRAALLACWPSPMEELAQGVARVMGEVV